ncbi:peptide chain release factor 1, mitochondrial isoform X1 [Denticeps clupeoides]|uniref:Prokaryotic-type class I peptide chain release factors domain-containing protein n=2 Tax=Denticeps clupeoides TaxID=299321 RepID=A0AAY4C2S7_9TELE|nr:peptide chain release factor 1, mitochondrial isoform X1 [Denticeps clupeoides]
MSLFKQSRLLALCRSSGRLSPTPSGVVGKCHRLSARFRHKSSSDLIANDAVQRHIRNLRVEYSDVTTQLHKGDVSESDRRALIRRQVALSPVANALKRAEDAAGDLLEVESLLQSRTQDTQMLDLLREEKCQITKRIEALNKNLIQTLVPVEEHDSSNVILEVAAGRTTGGDICQQFSREMFSMYQGFASYKEWDFEVFNYTPADYGGLHHAAVRISGENVYRWLKFEGGTHRVQRIPEMGLSSRMQRIHTGTMTVIVLPQCDEVEISIDPKDLRIDTFRSRGAGGQSVNTTDSAVRIVHLPTGTVAECQESRSQLQNREAAMRLLRARLYQSTVGKQTEQRHTARRQQVGTRAQSERIRSYNFSQDRVTDHRIGYVTRDIKEFMRGGEQLDELISDLLDHSECEALLELVENADCARRRQSHSVEPSPKTRLDSQH